MGLEGDDAEEANKKNKKIKIKKDGVRCVQNNSKNNNLNSRASWVLCVLRLESVWAHSRTGSVAPPKFKRFKSRPPGRNSQLAVLSVRASPSRAPHRRQAAGQHRPPIFLEERLYLGAFCGNELEMRLNDAKTGWSAPKTVYTLQQNLSTWHPRELLADRSWPFTHATVHAHIPTLHNTYSSSKCLPNETAWC